MASAFWRRRKSGHADDSGRLKARRRRESALGRTLEQLEARAMLAVFAYGRPDGSTLIALDGNQGLTDVYLRGVGTGVQVATNAEFSVVVTTDPQERDWLSPNGLNPNFYQVSGSSPLYITNATPNKLDIPLTEASGFTTTDRARTTDFVLSNGNIEIGAPGGVVGEIEYDGSTWSFSADADGLLSFQLVGGPGTGPVPIDGRSFLNPGRTALDNRGAGLRGTISVEWSAPVLTFVDTCPVITTASYLFRDGTGSGGATVIAKPWTESDVRVSAGGRISFAIPPASVNPSFGGTTLLTAGGGINTVAGTNVFTGTITVYDVSTTGIPGPTTENLTFGFSNASGTFVFTPRQNDWLEIAPGSTPAALRFVNRYGAGTAVTPGEVFVQPGRVTIQGTQRWFEYREESAPSDVTVWAGLDVSNAITVEMTRAGGSFNVLSPIVKAPALTVLGSSTVNLEAPISVTGNIVLGPGQIEGSVFPTITTAVFDAASAAANYSFSVVDGSLTVSPSGSLSGALPAADGSITTATGSVAGQMVDADLFVQGQIFGTTQFYDLTNAVYSRPNVFTTLSDATGLDSGLVRGGTVVINLAARGSTPAVPDPTNADTSYHAVDLRTQIDTLRTRAAGAAPLFPAGSMYPYLLSIREADAITFDAVAGSSRPISLAADGVMTMSSALSTLSDVTIAASGANSSFTVSAPIQTRFGAIDISASSVALRNSVQVTNAAVDPTKSDISITASNGDIIGQNLLAAVNNVSLVQRKAGTGSRVDVGGIRARSATVDAVGDVSLGTTVETLSGRSGGGFIVRETDDISIPSLRAGGRVALSAGGIDGGTATANPIALTARIDDVTALEVTAPNGSADVVVNTPRLLTLGGAATPVVSNMLAAGNVTIRSTTGDLRLFDAPLAGGNARVVKAASTGPLTATYNPGTPNVVAGTLTGTGSINKLGLFDGQTLAVGDRVLVRSGSRPTVSGSTTTNSNGVYTVARVGGGAGINANWQLTRATDSNSAAKLGSGSYVRVATGTTYGDTLWQMSYLAFPTTAADLSDASTIEIPATYAGIDDLVLGQRVTGAGIAANAVISAIDTDPVTGARTGLITLSTLFGNPVTNPGGSAVVTFVAPVFGQSPVTATQKTTVTTNIGSDAIGKSASFIVSSAGGTNSAAGSLGKMLLVRQQNDTSSSANPDQVMSFTVGNLPGPIRLTQELPVIRKAFGITAGSAFVDGSLIVTSRNGLPTTPSTVVNGFEFVAGSGATTDPSGNPQAGASLTGFTVTGFAKGAAVKIDGVPGILVNEVTLGRDGTGQRQANRQGVLVTGAGATSATILNSSIFAATDAGIAVESGASGVKVVGSTVGGTNINNAVGIRLSSTAVDAVSKISNQVGVEPAGPTATIATAVVRLTANSASFTLPATYAGRAALYAGLGVRGTGIPPGAVITAINATSGLVTISVPATTTGNSAVSFGNFVTTTLGATTLALPAGVTIGNLFLGQSVSGTGIPPGARIAAIDVPNKLITLTAPMTASGTTNVSFGVGGRNAITGNLQGILLTAGVNTLINTDVFANAYDGIVVNGGGQQIGTTKTRSATSNAIYANGGFGIRLQNGTASVQGNYLGMQVNGATSRPNTAGAVNPQLASQLGTPDAIKKTDNFENLYGPVSGSTGTGGGGGGGGSTGGAKPPSTLFPLR